MRKYFWIFAFILHIFAFFWQLQSNHLYLSDSKEYLWASENLKNGILNCADPASIDFHNPDFFTKRPPIYPIVLLSLKSIFYSDIWVIFWQNILSLSILYILVSWIQASQKKVNVGILSVLLVLSPAQMMYANMIMSEMLLQFWVILAAYLSWKFLQNFERKYFIYLQLIFCLAFLTKPVMYLFIFPLLGFSLYWIFQQKLWRLLSFAFIPMFVCLAYCQWNFYKTGYFHFSSIQKINLLTYNTWHFLLNQMPENKVDSTISDILTRCNQSPNYAEQSTCQNHAAYQILFSQENLPKYAWTHFKGMFQLFLDPGRFDLYNFLGLESKSSTGLLHEFHQNGITSVFNFLIKQPIFILLFIAILLVSNIFKLLIIILLPIFKRDKFVVFPYLLLVYVAFLTGPIGASRFLVPFLPIYFWLIHLFFVGRKNTM